ncbi:MAG: phosphonate metabolism protein/1,5-bisphosphokinase (PRPP-forming) PhnN [Pseudomonadota bacterium]
MTQQGRLIAVVGPSGVGKDSVMAGLKDALPQLHLVQRVITRPREAGGEDHTPASALEFDAMAAKGAFALHWQAHGLRYGIPVQVSERLAGGTDCLVNLSRKVLNDADEAFAQFIVLNITARPETLAARLAARGREGHADIARRLQEAEKPLPQGLDIRHVSNDGPLADAVAQAAARLQLERV